LPETLFDRPFPGEQEERDRDALARQGRAGVGAGLPEHQRASKSPLAKRGNPAPWLIRDGAGTKRTAGGSRGGGIMAAEG
jgi:hypothetical protein